MSRITKKAVREALKGIGGWTFGLSTSALSPWHNNPVLLIDSSTANCKPHMENIFSALREAGLTITRFDKKEGWLNSRLVLGIRGDEEKKP